jgi:hypothetical protein
LTEIPGRRLGSLPRRHTVSAPRKNWGVALGLRSHFPVSLKPVQIIVEISEGEDGRAIGTVRAAGESRARTFSGNLEFLAQIENLYRIGAEMAGEESGPSETES